VPFLTFLAQTTPPPPSGIWYPTIIGILVVVSAIALFCGSIYVLLATNLGARLGFLLAFTAVTGFMVLLTMLWLFTTSPLNTLKGTIPAWKVEAVVKNLNAKSLPAPVRDLKHTGRVMAMAQTSTVKAAADIKLVLAQPIANIPLAADANKFAIFSAVTDYKETKYYDIGGSTPHLVDWQLNHTPQYAVVQFCGTVPNNQPFGLPPPTPTCDPTSSKNGFVVLQYEYGSLRIPPFVSFMAASILFTLGLLALHWREKDERAAEKAKAAASQTLTPAPST
jgi:hypothetical protein